MNQQNIDTRVTAYVFGELSSEQAAAFERELSQSRPLQREVAEIREAIAALESEFQSRSTEIAPPQRKQIERAIRQRVAPPVVDVAQPERANQAVEVAPLSKEQLNRRWMIAVALAGCALVMGSLAIPYFRDSTDQRVTLSVYPSEESLGNTAKSQQARELVESFNQLMSENRAEEAAGVAQRFGELQPNDPVSETLRRSSELARGSSVVDELVVADKLSITEREESLSASNPTLTDTIAFEPMAAPGGSAIASVDAKEMAESAPSPLDGSPLDGSALGYAGGALRGGYAMPDEDGLIDIEDLRQPDGNVNEGMTELARPRRSRRTRSNAGFEDFGMYGGGMGGALGGGASGSMGMEDMDVEMSYGAQMGSGEQQDMMMMGGMGGEADFGMDAYSAAPAIIIGAEEESLLGLTPSDSSRGDRFDPIEDNPFLEVRQAPLSTFSIDVDTASYAKVRSLLLRNVLPRPDAVRIEEMLNYFDYDYPSPNDDHPFAASMEVADCPWNPQHRLARIGIRGKVFEADRPSSNLVFLLDVSGSMDEPNKLPLVIEGMKMLTDQLTENDKVGIVVYAGAAGLVLDSTRGDHKQQIIGALDRLKAGGSTNGGQGIMLAYELARDNFIVGGTNRVILCSDGDFNVGVTGTDQLVAIAQENAKSNIFLSVLGFGIGNHNDSMMEQISNNGNGNYAFIDSKGEARKVLVEELGSTLITIAKDVKIQIEFNPKEVVAYRLIGYENRVLAAADFNDDKKDAGEIGAGHTVTALYEIVPVAETPASKSTENASPTVDALRYQQPHRLSEKAKSGELLILKLRYKQPEGDTSTLMEIPITDSGKRFAQADRDFQFAASVAEFGMLLRDSPHKGNATFEQVETIAREGAKGDDFGYRNEFVSLVRKARQLRGE